MANWLGWSFFLSARHWSIETVAKCTALTEISGMSAWTSARVGVS